MNAPEAARPPGGPARFAAWSAAGAALALACVWAGCGLHDGWLGAAGQILAKRLLKQAAWLLPLAAVWGVFFHWVYAPVLRPGGGKTHWLVLYAIPRAFLHFPLYGFIALFGMMAGLALAGWNAVAGRLRPSQDAASSPGVQELMERWLSVPVWFIMMPFPLLGMENEGDLRMPVTVSTRALLLRLLPAACVMTAFWTGMVSEDSGERVDPHWLSVAAAFWLGELLVTALELMPVLRARRGLPP